MKIKICCPNCDYDQEIETVFKSVKVGDPLECSNCKTRLEVKAVTDVVSVMKYRPPMMVIDKVKKYANT